MFDGNIERPLSKMSPKEKLEYLWLQMMFKWQIRNKRIIPKEENSAGLKTKIKLKL